MEEKKKMKELPAQSRPYERCFSCGPGALTDAELLSVIIRTGANGIPSVELAEQILNLTGPKGLTGLSNLSVKELMEIRGIGMVKAIQIVCIAELSRRIASTGRGKQLIFREPQTVPAYYMESLRHKEKEELWLLMLDSKSALLAESVLSMGTVNYAVAAPREIFLEALKYKAVSIIMMHNHPSGDPSPSESDILLTRRVQEAGNVIGISLLDHIIIGDKRFLSFRQQQII